MFSDEKKISSEYRGDISRAIVGGILKGYGIEEGDPMYVAPEDRLKLW